MKKFLVSTVIALVMGSFFVSNASAFDGQVELTNRVGEEARCWAPTVLMQNQTYKILFSCRDITYPGGNEVFYYVVWANPASGGNPQRLGSLGLGKAEYETRVEFSALFVTKERSSNVSKPSGTIVMQGSLKSVPLLQGSGTSTGTNTNTTTSSPTPDAVVEITPIPTTQPRTGIAKYLTSGILAILGIAGIIFIVFVVTKR